MESTPLPGNEQIKVLIFLCISLVLCFVIVGIPAFFVILLGMFAMQRSRDFSAMDLTFKIVNVYAALLFLGSVFVTLFMLKAEYEFCQYYTRHASRDCDSPISFVLETYKGNEFLFFLVFASVAYFLYRFLFNYLFVKPLKDHYAWVGSNGIFTKSAKVANEHEINIIKTDKLKAYSVADELQKWIQLRDEGHISEEEFQKAKEKILK